VTEFGSLALEIQYCLGECEEGKPSSENKKGFDIDKNKYCVEYIS